MKSDSQNSIMPASDLTSSDTEGPMRKKRGLPSRSVFKASYRTIGSAHAPPIQPRSVPFAVMIAFTSGLAEVGFSHRTTVAIANGWTTW